MGYYIQGPTHNKASAIIEEHGGKVVVKPDLLSDIPDDEALVCVIPLVVEAPSISISDLPIIVTASSQVVKN